MAQGVLPDNLSFDFGQSIINQVVGVFAKERAIQDEMRIMDMRLEKDNKNWELRQQYLQKQKELDITKQSKMFEAQNIQKQIFDKTGKYLALDEIIKQLEYSVDSAQSIIDKNLKDVTLQKSWEVWEKLPQATKKNMNFENFKSLGYNEQIELMEVAGSEAEKEKETTRRSILGIPEETQIDTAQPQINIESTPEPQIQPTQQTQPITYTVKPGDTLSQIAKQYGITDWRQIQAANSEITDPTKMKIGTVLNIPVNQTAQTQTTPQQSAVSKQTISAPIQKTFSGYTPKQTEILTSRQQAIQNYQQELNNITEKLNKAIVENLDDKDIKLLENKRKEIINLLQTSQKDFRNAETEFAKETRATSTSRSGGATKQPITLEGYNYAIAELQKDYKEAKTKKEKEMILKNIREYTNERNLKYPNQPKTTTTKTGSIPLSNFFKKQKLNKQNRGNKNG